MRSIRAGSWQGKHLKQQTDFETFLAKARR
jgi:hypothetical protein